MLLSFQQASYEKGLTTQIGPRISRANTMTAIDMAVSDNKHQVSTDHMISRTSRYSRSSYEDLTQLISECKVENSSEMDFYPASSQSPVDGPVVDGNYWAMPAEASYGDGMTAARKEAKDLAIQRVQERIRKSKQVIAECLVSVEDEVTSDQSHIKMVQFDSNIDESYWVWESPEQQQNELVSMPLPMNVDEHPSMIQNEYDSDSYWSFPSESSYAEMTVARKDARELVLRRVQERISQRQAKYWHWNASV
jgi:hypothetical protein